MISFGDIKGIANVLKEAGKIEQYRQILDFQQMLLEMQEENKKLKTDNDKLREKLKYKGQVIFEDPFYFVIKGEQRDGPFCVACWDKNKELIRIPSTGKGDYQVKCPVCKNEYRDPSYRPPTRRSNYADDWTL